MNFAESTYSYNADGSVRAEFVTKKDGVLPLTYFARLFGASLVNVFRWDKYDFRGFLLNAAFVEYDGIKCDIEHNPLEDEKFQPLPGKSIEPWGQRLWINRAGDRVLSDEEKSALPANDQGEFRCLRCMELRPESKDYNGDTIYVTEEATSVLAEVLILDVAIGDPVNERYQYECQHDENFANKFGYALKEGQERLEEALEEKQVVSCMAHCIAHAIFGSIFGGDDDDSNEDKPEQSEEEPDGPKEAEQPKESEQ